MIEDKRDGEFTYFEAPVTGWKVLLKSWWLWGLIIIGLIVFFNQHLIPRSLQYGVYTFIAVFVITWFYLGRPEGFALSSINMSDGHIDLQPLNRFQLERVTENPQKVIMFSSPLGPVALIGHRLISLNEEGQPNIHALLEVQTNSEIANRVASSQSRIMKEYLTLKRSTEIIADEEFAKVYFGWREKERLDLEDMKPKD